MNKKRVTQKSMKTKPYSRSSFQLQFGRKDLERNKQTLQSDLERLKNSSKADAFLLGPVAGGQGRENLLLLNVFCFSLWMPVALLKSLLGFYIFSLDFLSKSKKRDI